MGDSKILSGVTSDHAEEAIVSPVGAPRVAANPVLFSGDGVDTVADDGDLVVDQRESDVLLVDAISHVQLPSRGGVDTAAERSILQGLNHGSLTTDAVVLRGVEDNLGVLGFAVVNSRLTRRRGHRVAVHASVHGIGSVLQVESNILLAR